jgi:hypothetical protein
MINNDEGLTIVKLIFIIMILILIAIIGVFIGKKLWKNSASKDEKTDLLYIQAKCKVIYDKHIIDENEQLLGEKITEYIENNEINNIIQENQNDMWYKLNQYDLDKISADYINADDGYIINYETEEVICIKGITDGNDIYYKLSDLIEEENNEDDSSNNTEETNKNNENTENIETEKDDIQE